MPFVDKLTLDRKFPLRAEFVAAIGGNMATLPSSLEAAEEETPGAPSGLRDPGVRREHKPAFRRTRFACPRCDVVATQSWFHPLQPTLHPRTGSNPPVVAYETIKDLALSTCAACSAKCLWFESRLVYPAKLSDYQVPTDMPPEVQRDFEEAASIAAASPRASAALLRMCIEGLCKTITGKDDFYAAVTELEEQGIPDEIVVAMDVVRLTGNEALHAGKLYGSDDEKTVGILFRLAGLIVNWAITERTALKDLIDKIPPGKLEKIKERREKAAEKAAQKAATKSN